MIVPVSPTYAVTDSAGIGWEVVLTRTEQVGTGSPAQAQSPVPATRPAADTRASAGTVAEVERTLRAVFAAAERNDLAALDMLYAGDSLTVVEGAGINRGWRDYRDHLPPILVRSPWVGQEVTSPIRVAGSADVFEAVVSVSVLDASGTAIVESTTMATCGTGCRGVFATAVAVEFDATQTGTVRVYEVSAEDGSPINVVDIPVLLIA